MLAAGAWKLGQQNLITFVLTDFNGNEVTGLGSTFTVQLAKAGAIFQSGAGVKAEIGHGWYSYLTTSAEADTPGPVPVRVTGPGIVQQNLEYVVEGRNIHAVEYEYTVINGETLQPIEGVRVWFATNSSGSHTAWAGVTDGFGVARDTAGNLPRLDPGLYYVFRRKVGFSFLDPDEEVVS